MDHIRRAVDEEMKKLRALGLMHESAVQAAMDRVATERASEGYVYLASPYSHPDSEMRKARFIGVCIAAGALMKKGMVLFSPIAHTYPIEIHGGLPGNWDFWEKYDRYFVENAQSVLVLTLDGYKESKGVNAEIKIAEERGIEVSYISYEEAVA